MGKIYLVFVGRVPGFYTNWESCKAQVSGFSNAVYCKFDDLHEALATHSRFNEDRKWCSENPVHVCPSCQQCMEFRISSSRETVGSHYYACKTAVCCYFAWVADIRIKHHGHKLDAVEAQVGASCPPSASSSADMSRLVSRFEALEDLVLELVKMNL